LSPWFLVGTAGVAFIVIISGSLLGRTPQGSTVGSSTASASQPPQDCAVTRPDVPFEAPSPHPKTLPNVDGAVWYGSDHLWTMLRPAGEVWHRLLNAPHTFTNKTFWFSVDWNPDNEPEPAITVVATRLDGPGSVTFGPGTNAGADFGAAMLVGVDLPTAGCWRISGRYRGAELAYVLSAEEDPQ
jgi:hypothetical protein